jgi:hypothetical protein
MAVKCTLQLDLSNHASSQTPSARNHTRNEISRLFTAIRGGKSKYYTTGNFFCSVAFVGAQCIGV